MTSRVADAASPAVLAKSSAWTDLGLTLPIFVSYHLGVMFLPVRNAADVVTQELALLAHNDRIAYAALTVGLGSLFVAVLLLAGRGQALRLASFAWLALEGVLYAIGMRVAAAAIVGELFLVPGLIEGRFMGLVMSLGAGFYEEVAFRVLLFGVGLRCLKLALRPTSWLSRASLAAGWAVLAALLFSGWHHIGALGEPFDVQVFVFRAVCALLFTLIYAVRGFAPVVWTHVTYDLWVLVA